MGDIKKINLIAMNDILRKYSDEEHPINAQEIIDIMEDNGLHAERKSVYRAVKTLIDYGIDINKTKLPKNGYYIGQRNFEVAEIRLLIDAVLTAPFITRKKTKELINKLSSLISTYEADRISNQVYFDNRIKFNNEEIYYGIDTINKAITENKKVVFTYNHQILNNNRITLDEGKKFCVSPYALIWSNDKYYLAGCNDKFNKITNYRVDRMRKVKTIDQIRRPVNEVSSFTKEFNTAIYLKKNINMFPGKASTVTLECKFSALDMVIDKFGQACKYATVDCNKFKISTNVYVSEGLKEWLIAHYDTVRVLSPKTLNDDIKENIKKLYEIYF